MSQVYTALVFPLVLLVGQAIVALGQRKISQRMDEGQAKTDAKHKAEAEWQAHVVTRLDQQDGRIDTIITAQCSQMRSDLVHRAHRYIDDLGCAGTEEKQSFWAEYEDYMRICDANNITNHFIDKLANQVMSLPNRDEKR